MKKYIVLLITVASMVMSGCQNEKMEKPIEDKKTHKLTITASADAETKTSISAVAGGYQISWNVDDFIQLHEATVHPSIIDYDVVRSYDSNCIQSEDILDNKASFSFEIEDRDVEGAQYTYLATYGPYSYVNYIDWSTYEYEYNSWKNTFDYDGEYVDPHMVVVMMFPIYQHPSANSFDPYADLMVSKAVTTSEQLSGEASFSFARLGTVVKMTLTGLDDYVGCQIPSLMLSFGDSYQLPYEIQYDYVLNKYVAGGSEGGDFMGGQPLTIESDQIYVKEDGTADVWIRLLAGEVTDGFRVDFTLCSDTDEFALARYVNLAEQGKILKFNEGKMTTFSVGDFCIPDVEAVGYIDYEINDNKDGFTATWEGVENAAGYECYILSSTSQRTDLTPVDNGDGTYTVTVDGIAKDTYTIFVRAIPAEGHELLYNDYTTETLLVGVPSVWWFAHDAFKDSDSTDVDGEYIIEFSPGKVRFQNLGPVYDSSWQALSASGPWFMYSTEPLEMHSIELWSKDDSHLNFDVFASSEPGAESLLLEGVVIEVSDIDVGEGSYKYDHVHKKVRYTFPDGGNYRYYKIKGAESGIVMTSQYTYVYYYE